ncbi:protein of unknown function [Methylococcus capsulatus]|uniref:Uncharacterized protein n=1 Tax=Methylococcus capsulatus TaxID=414 RepID=A0AA35V3H0_METCP|nr:protein of unknown function [Methylococcus capsulatus]
MLRFFESYSGISGHHTHAMEAAIATRHCDFPSSRFLHPFSKKKLSCLDRAFAPQSDGPCRVCIKFLAWFSAQGIRALISAHRLDDAPMPRRPGDPGRFLRLAADDRLAPPFRPRGRRQRHANLHARKFPVRSMRPSSTHPSP